MTTYIIKKEVSRFIPGWCFIYIRNMNLFIFIEKVKDTDFPKLIELQDHLKENIVPAGIQVALVEVDTNRRRNIELDPEKYITRNMTPQLALKEKHK